MTTIPQKNADPILPEVPARPIDPKAVWDGGNPAGPPAKSARRPPRVGQALDPADSVQQSATSAPTLPVAATVAREVLVVSPSQSGSSALGV